MSETSKNEVQDMGTHCSFESCNRLDFLPVKCEHCRISFCKDHYSVTSHKCSKYEEASEKKEPIIFKSPVNAYQCNLTECQAKEAIEFLCEFCQLNFCMKHRLQTDHSCSKLPKPSSEPEKKQVKEFKFELKQNVSEKNAGLQAKLILMKLKKAAVGPPGLPEELKYYCFVIYLSAKKEFYFSIKWPIGRCIDFLFDKLSINKANLTKLKLWLGETQIDSSLTVEEFMKINSAQQGCLLELK